MAWTAPASYSVGEVLTAAKLNTHLRDNLKYLKGQAGGVSLEDELVISSAVARQLTLVNSSGNQRSYFAMSNAGLGIWDLNRNTGSGAFDDTSKATARIIADVSGTSSFFTFSTANAANTAATERVRITGDGKVGIGTNAPQAILHTYDAISGFIKWEFDGIDGTARTVIPNGTGDVVYNITFWALIRSSGGTVVHVLPTNVAPGANVSMYSIGADIVQFQVNANGAVTVQRTGGTLTYKVSLVCHWL